MNINSPDIERLIQKKYIVNKKTLFITTDEKDYLNTLINTERLKIYIPAKYTSLKVRLKFLGWEVDIELLEIFSSLSIWIVCTDIINLIHTHKVNNIYDLAFHLLPPISWAIISGTIAFVHLYAVLMDETGSEECSKKECYLGYLKVRMQAMAIACLFNVAVTSSVWLAHSYVLIFKFMLLFTISSAWSHIRLRKQYSKLKARQEKGKKIDTIT